MEPVRYIHAADLHLDVPFQGISDQSASGGILSRLLRESTFIALNRLFNYCIAEKPDFLVLAGDIYNQENYSIRAQLTLREQCEKLNDLGVRVFIAHGNHDPLTSRFKTVNWPSNVTIFGPEAEHHVLEREGVPFCVVHGISHESAREGRNLSRFFKRDDRHDCFQIGVLHATVDGESKADRYAPCSLGDLAQCGLDAWALGHVHEHHILGTNPFIAYTGSAQGLHINECGPHGCLLVTATPKGKRYECMPSFLPLGPVQWEKIEINVDGVTGLEEIQDRMNQGIESVLGAVGPSCEAVIARITLVGRTVLNNELRKDNNCADLAAALSHLGTGKPGFWLKDICLQTTSPVDRDEYLKREDLLGETMRLIARMRDSRETFESVSGLAMGQLYDNLRLRRNIQRPDEAMMQNLLDDAERLCQDMLEGR